ncbi:MAG: TMEM175 family protein [Pseudomonadota bacterium]
MLRENISAQLDNDPDFRWRGEQVSRIENLSDIVFALAFSMIVTASDTPFTFSGIKTYLISLVPISMAVIVLLATWNRHFLFFRRYGLADNRIVWLNAMLLLTILSIAYPLRFIFDSLFAWALAMMGSFEMMERIEVGSYRQAGEIVAYFGVIFAVLNLLQSQIYAHALSKSDMLALNDLERAHTIYSVRVARLDVVTGGLAAGLAYWTILGPFAGFLVQVALPIRWILRRMTLLPAQRVAASNSPAP